MKNLPARTIILAAFMQISTAFAADLPSYEIVAIRQWSRQDGAVRKDNFHAWKIDRLNGRLLNCSVSVASGQSDPEIDGSCTLFSDTLELKQSSFSIAPYAGGAPVSDNQSVWKINLANGHTQFCYGINYSSFQCKNIEDVLQK
ncbi:hypothetical protein [Methylobacterium oryzisoli]|uniref:hypothetical protein n=1 Tax=Methylobacterium oryzisoli TaxID=3385502 RepID=UPI00389282D8